MIIRKHYFVSGRVQGVGFRYRAYHLANSLGVTGYAVNLYDGRVELELQGEETLVNGFLSKIEEGSFISIDEIESNDMEVNEQEYRFYVD